MITTATVVNVIGEVKWCAVQDWHSTYLQIEVKQIKTGKDRMFTMLEDQLVHPLTKRMPRITHNQLLTFQVKNCIALSQTIVIVPFSRRWTKCIVLLRIHHWTFALDGQIERLLAFPVKIRL